MASVKSVVPVVLLREQRREQWNSVILFIVFLIARQLHVQRDTVLPILSVRPMPVLCLNEWTYRHTFSTLW